MAFGVEVGLGPGHIVLDGDPATLPKKGTASQFSAQVYCGQTAAWIKMPLGTEVDLCPGDVVLDGDQALPKRGIAPSFPPMSMARSPISATAELLFMFLQACRFEQIKSSAVAEMGERSHNRYEPKRAGVLCHNAHSPEIGGCAPLGEGELGPM